MFRLIADQAPDAIIFADRQGTIRVWNNAVLPAWERTKGDDGYVSFELDPLIEDEAAGLDNSERVRRYIELGEKWSAGHFGKASLWRAFGVRPIGKG